MAHTTSAVDNHLLALLSPKDLAALGKHFEEVELPLRQSLSQPEGITHVHFPLRGMISLVPEFRDGTMIEVGLVGREGFLGVPLVLSDLSSPLAAMVQGEGSALRMQADTFLKKVASIPAFRKILLRYVQSLFVQVTQTAMCNGRHPLPQRLGRWILEAHDRMSGDEVSLSHEFLAIMLGTRRAGVTVALGEFSDRGLVTIGHGVIGISDRKGIEAAACECYASVQKQNLRLFPH